MSTVLWIIGMAVLGLIAGAIARLLVPGRQPIGLFMTMVLGIAGSFVGGFLSSLLFGGELIEATGLIGSIIGATIVLVLYVWYSKKSAGHAA